MRIVLVFLAAVSVAAPAYAYEAIDEFTGGSIKGVVKLSRPAPPARAVAVHKDMKVCGDTQHLTKHRVHPKGGFAGVVVELVGIERGKKAERREVVVDQRACVYVPRISAFPVGTTVVLKNSDLTLHNTHTYLQQDGRTLFNLALPAKLPGIKKRIRDSGLIKYTCDAGHPWMLAWSYVTEHPYVVVTGDDGSFELTDVPPGTYSLKAWHEVEGEKTTEVVVTASRSSSVELTF